MKKKMRRRRTEGRGRKGNAACWTRRSTNRTAVAKGSPTSDTPPQDELFNSKCHFFYINFFFLLLPPDVRATRSIESSLRATRMIETSTAGGAAAGRDKVKSSQTEVDAWKTKRWEGEAWRAD